MRSDSPESEIRARIQKRLKAMRDKAIEDNPPGIPTDTILRPTKKYNSDLLNNIAVSSGPASFFDAIRTSPANDNSTKVQKEDDRPPQRGQRASNGHVAWSDDDDDSLVSAESTLKSRRELDIHEAEDPEGYQNQRHQQRVERREERRIWDSDEERGRERAPKVIHEYNHTGGAFSSAGDRFGGRYGRPERKPFSRQRESAREWVPSQQSSQEIRAMSLSAVLRNLNTLCLEEIPPPSAEKLLREIMESAPLQKYARDLLRMYDGKRHVFDACTVLMKLALEDTVWYPSLTLALRLMCKSMMIVSDAENLVRKVSDSVRMVFFDSRDGNHEFALTLFHICHAGYGNNPQG